MEAPYLLYVEDDPQDVILTRRALTRANLTNPIKVVTDGEEALKWLLGDSPLPLFVLLDLRLPKVDGIDVLRQIRANEKTKLLPVVVFTVSEDDRDRVESYKLGVNAYVHKPLDFLQFAEAAKNIGLFFVLLSRSAAPAGNSI